MKSKFHILSFLSNYSPKTTLDEEIIKSILATKFQIPRKGVINGLRANLTPLDIHSFISWLESGLESLKMAKSKNKVVLLGNCTLDSCPVLCSLDPSDPSSFSSIPCSALPCDIEEATEDEIHALQSSILSHNLQPDPSTMTLTSLYRPRNGHRVIFYDRTLEIKGVGVVREVTAEDDVIFYCYYAYPSLTSPERLGYSMHENPKYNLRNIHFENIDKDNRQTILGNSTSCFRRLGRELERNGKVWKDKMLRIEPLKVEVERGEVYFYISDKLKVITDVEKKTPVSHMRYLAGNYFTTRQSASAMLERFRELLKVALASDTWPDPPSYF